MDCDIHVETRGEMALALADGTTFRLTAIADRIEIDREGQAYVFDYKTGAPPSNKQVKVGWSPQLTLEAAMIEAGAFEDDRPAARFRRRLCRIAQRAAKTQLARMERRALRRRRRRASRAA